jgi:hypothetical protein
MEITYRRTVQVREYESITLELKATTKEFEPAVHTIEQLVDTELEAHRDKLIEHYMRDTSDSEGLGYEEI